MEGKLIFGDGQMACGCSFYNGEIRSLCPNHRLGYWQEMSERFKVEPLKGALAELRACPACCEKRIHAKGEWTEFHPLAGHGTIKDNGGWCCEAARMEHEKGKAK